MIAQTAAILATLAGASAFVAPTQFAGKALVSNVRSSSALKMADASQLPGAAPWGVFDPLNIASQVDDADLKKYRENELKHGRVAMLAVVGSLVQESFHPLFDLGEDIGPSIYHFQLIENSVSWFWEAILFAIGVFEVNNIQKGWQIKPLSLQVADLKEDYVPGDLGFDPLKLGKPEEFEALQNKELNNGRLAMFAILGFWAQELVNGKEILANLSS